jgi:hypothetical protein
MGESGVAYGTVVKVAVLRRCDGMGLQYVHIPAKIL